MKNLKRVSKKAIEFCELSGINPYWLKDQIKINKIELRQCETKKEMDNNGVDYNYPYVIYNPYDIKLTRI